MKVSIDYAYCNACGLCREVCPEMAVRPKLCEPRHLYEVQATRCSGCGECLDYCPAPGALVVEGGPGFADASPSAGDFRGAPRLAGASPSVGGLGGPFDGPPCR